MNVMCDNMELSDLVTLWIEKILCMKKRICCEIV